jgi:hypothetical protein
LTATTQWTPIPVQLACALDTWRSLADNRRTMPISWNEIRHRAMQFSHEWAGESREHAEAKSFWDEFFQVFGMRRRTVASFEEPVKKLSGEYGYIDLFWSGVLLVEHKSRGKDLGRAELQAIQYIQDLAREQRNDEIPRYIIVSDFERIALHDLEAQPGANTATLQFPLKDLHKQIQSFAFIPGYKQHTFEDQDPINIRAVGRLGKLHDALKAGGYAGHALERFLVRILFCLFAEDTGIFEREAFHLYIVNRTAEDGSDLGLHLARLFDVLNTPDAKRQKNLDEVLSVFPYVNGDLFAENLGFVDFDSDMREALIKCTRFDWSQISPAIFGSLFQGIMEPQERRQLGGHYTSEKDILKVVRSLFLDDLWTEFDVAKKSPTKLQRLHERLGNLRFFDPACGCGNFLVIAYRELRRLELEILKLVHDTKQQRVDVSDLTRLDVDAFYGIEISEWPARIAEVAMWLMDHQMNVQLSEVFGLPLFRLPLRKRPQIECGNALRMDWKKLLPPNKCSFVLGNPPFVGKKEQSADQKQDMDDLFGKVKGAGVLDYVCSWYLRAAEYIDGTNIRVAFVSTNSITQGEQVGVLWHELIEKHGLSIHFAHTTFAWESEARGKAHVHVVIIGFSKADIEPKQLFEYDSPRGEPHRIKVKRINPYLADAPNVYVYPRSAPLNGAPPISYGSMMIDKPRSAGDDEGLVISPAERKALLAECPDLRPYIRRLLGGDELINSIERWCLWLEDAPPALLKQSPRLRARIEAVKRFRLSSGRPQTRELAAFPTLFGERRQPTTRYLLVPKVSSETRRYIPIGFCDPSIIASGSALIVPSATPYHFGVLSSAMHNAWMRYVGGRMKSDYQYSSRIVYNNFPWPHEPWA